MTKILWHTMMSLDGFIAGPEDSMEWAFKAPGRSELADEVRDGTGAILGGRRWYDAAAAKYDGVAGVYGGRWTGPVFVLTHHPQDAPDDPAVTFLSDGLPDAVARASEAAGAKNVVIFGANTAQQCLAAGLLDELVIHVAPVLLGDGVRLYGSPGATREVELEGQIADLRYTVARSK
jgi:dihydrofolate reductase